MPGTDDDATDDDDDEAADEARRRRFRRGGLLPLAICDAGEREEAFLLALPKLHNDSYAILVRPNTGQSPFDEEWGELHRKYERVTPEAAEAGWTSATRDGPRQGGRAAVHDPAAHGLDAAAAAARGLVDKMMGSLSTARDAKIKRCACRWASAVWWACASRRRSSSRCAVPAVAARAQPRAARS